MEYSKKTLRFWKKTLRFWKKTLKSLKKVKEFFKKTLVFYQATVITKNSSTFFHYNNFLWQISPMQYVSQQVTVRQYVIPTICVKHDLHLFLLNHFFRKKSRKYIPQKLSWGFSQTMERVFPNNGNILRKQCPLFRV